MDEEFTSTEGDELEQLFAVATSPTPGLPFSDPYIGITFLRNQATGQLFAEEPDLSEESEPTMVLIGDYKDQDGQIVLLARYISEHSLELPIAIHYHHSRVRADYPEWSNLRHFFWLDVAGEFWRLVDEVDSYLLSTSPLYRGLVHELNIDPEGDDATTAIIGPLSLDFSPVYQKHFRRQ
jgi:hypothetical protein